MNPEVSHFLDELNHPLRDLIEELRSIILESRDDIRENIKWNGPNYTIMGYDRLSLKILPVKSLHLVFHRGVKVQAEPAERLLSEDYGLLTWKSNDRAVLLIKDRADLTKAKTHLPKLLANWFEATQ